MQRSRREARAFSRLSRRGRSIFFLMRCTFTGNISKGKSTLSRASHGERRMKRPVAKSAQFTVECRWLVSSAADSSTSCWLRVARSLAPQGDRELRPWCDLHRQAGSRAHTLTSGPGYAYACVTHTRTSREYGLRASCGSTKAPEGSYRELPRTHLSHFLIKPILNRSSSFDLFSLRRLPDNF